MHFEFQNPTKIIFGSGSLAKLGATAATIGRKALLVTGGGSVRRNGALDRALASLAEAGVAVVECPGVEPNPRLGTVRRGAELAAAENCDLVIALGGGSTMDAAKAMAGMIFHEGEPWEMFASGSHRQRPPSRALPVITVPTLAATGSEMNAGAVVTNETTTEKSFVSAPALYPKVAIVDPELTVSVPADQTAFGVCDLITHVTEGYFNGEDGTPLQDRFAEGVILTALEWGPRAVRDGADLEARAQIQWASVVALNGWVQVGTRAGFPVHVIEHTLSAHHDVAHGAGLAVVNPGWMRFAAQSRPERFAQFASRVMGVAGNGRSPEALAAEGIDRFEQFLRDLGCPTRLNELGISGDLIPRYAEDALRLGGNAGQLHGRPVMRQEDIVAVLEGVRGEVNR